MRTSIQCRKKWRVRADCICFVLFPSFGLLLTIHEEVKEFAFGMVWVLEQFDFYQFFRGNNYRAHLSRRVCCIEDVEPRSFLQRRSRTGSEQAGSWMQLLFECCCHQETSDIESFAVSWIVFVFLCQSCRACRKAMKRYTCKGCDVGGEKQVADHVLGKDLDAESGASQSVFCTYEL